MTPDPLRQVAEEQIDRMLTAWPSSRPPDGWRNEMRRGLCAAADEPADIRRAVTKAIQSSVGRYVPDIATMTQAVARQRQARIASEQDAERARRRQTENRPAEDWRGWLAWAAHIAHRQDRGDAISDPPPTVRPYLELVLDIGYRNHHGCGEYRDIDGHLHPADPDHDPVLTAGALAGAERIWRNNGRLPAPTPATLTSQPAAHAA